MRSDPSGAARRTLYQTAFRAVWYATFALTAAMAVPVELDREGGSAAWIVTLVPRFAQSDSLDAAARNALERADHREAEEIARQGVARRPMPAETLSLYAQALLLNNKEMPAISALQTAAGRGWRDRFVQRAVVLSSLQQTSRIVAAQRVIGLWRVGERGGWLMDLTRATLGTSDGLSAFKSLITHEDKYWVSDFLVWAVPNLSVGKVETITTQIADMHVKLDCSSLSNEVQGLLRRGDGTSTELIWKTLCNPKHKSALSSLSFKSIDNEQDPFGWRYLDSPGVDMFTKNSAAGLQLHYSNSDLIAQKVAQRYILLLPGRYLLSERGSSPSYGLIWAITCVSQPNSAKYLGFEEVAPKKWIVSIPAQCPIQLITISARPGNGDIGPLTIHKLER